MSLVNEDAIAARDELPIDGVDPEVLADPIAGPALRCFLVLSRWPERFARSGWTAVEIFWSRYYWFRRYVGLRVGTAGPDAGLTDRLAALLAKPEPECSPDPADLAWVGALADRDAADGLRPAWDASIGSHPIAPGDVARLAKLGGVTDRDEWARQLAAEATIPDLILGEVRRDWDACFPTWLAQGRVRDLSRSIRLTRYRPSFANTLGDAFAERHWRESWFLHELLDRHPYDSVEALCAFDLLPAFAHEFAAREIPLPPDIFASGGPLPPVIRRELPLDRRQLGGVGEVLARLFAEDYGGGEEDPP